jgi:hypothetical protein
MHQATLEQATDFNATPEHRHGMTPEAALFEVPLDRSDGLDAVVIGDRQMAQAAVQGLLGQGNGLKTAVTEEGVAVEIDLPRTAARTNAAQDLSQGVVDGGHRARQKL